MVSVDLGNGFIKESLYIFSEGVKAYTERQVSMMNEKSPAILADLWREEFEKYLISMLPDIEAKAVLTDLYTVLNFLSKVAKELEYKKKDNIFDLFFERDLDLTCTLYGLAAEAIEEEFIEKLNNYAGNRFTQD